MQINLITRILIRNHISNSFLKSTETSSFFCINRQKSVAANVIAEKTSLALQKLFKCTNIEATDLYANLKRINENVHLALIKTNVNFFLRNGATLPTIMDNCHLLLIPTDDLRLSYKALNKLQWENLDDFLPLLGLSRKELKSILDLPSTPKRIYYFSSILKVKPSIVSKYFCKHLIMFEMEFELLKRKLMLLSKYNIPSLNLLRDLCVFQRSEENLIERLEQIKYSGVILKIMPWMLKCESSVLFRTMEIRAERGPVLEILVERLNWDKKMKSKMANAHSFTRKYGVEKVQQNLDFLMDKIDAQTITKCITILSIGHSKLVYRWKELTAIGVHIDANTIKILCSHQSRYDEYVTKIKKDNENKIK